MAKFRGQNAAVSITDKDDSDVPVGIMQDFEISADKNIETLFGSGSIKRQDEQATELEVSVSAELMSWTMDGYAALNSMTGSSGSWTGIDDTSDVPLAKVTATAKNNSGKQYNLTVTDVYFESLPVSGSRDDWISLDIDGTGKDLKIAEV